MWTEDRIKDYIKKKLDKKRYDHVINVKDMAIKLAEKYNVDKKKAEIAALCHDCAKNMSEKELLNVIKDHNLNLDWISLKNIQITHGLIGSIIMKEEMEIKDRDILNSVKYHTTGRANMSMLEKIIYLSDVIEISRDFKEVHDIRNLAFENIDEALIKSLECTIKYVLDKGELLHTNTVIARNCLINDKM